MAVLKTVKLKPTHLIPSRLERIMRPDRRILIEFEISTLVKSDDTTELILNFRQYKKRKGENELQKHIEVYFPIERKIDKKKAADFLCYGLNPEQIAFLLGPIADIANHLPVATSSNKKLEQHLLRVLRKGEHIFYDKCL